MSDASAAATDPAPPPGDVNPAAEASVAEEKVFEPAPVVRGEHAEPSATRVLEQQTAKIPSHWFLAASLTSMAASLTLEMTGNRRWSRFVGMWAPSLLVMGVYNKLVKSLGPR
jgi:hypothetical protein